MHGVERRRPPGPVFSMNRHSETPLGSSRFIIRPHQIVHAIYVRHSRKFNVRKASHSRQAGSTRLVRGKYSDGIPSLSNLALDFFTLTLSAHWRHGGLAFCAVQNQRHGAPVNCWIGHAMPLPRNRSAPPRTLANRLRSHCGHKAADAVRHWARPRGFVRHGRRE